MTFNKLEYIIEREIKAMENYIDNKTLYIEHQSKCDKKYGKYPSSYNGCGWISYYNYFRSISNYINEDSAGKIADACRRMFAEHLWFGGIIGTSPFYMLKALKSLEIEECEMKVVNIYKKLDVTNNGIIYYFTGKAFHYVSFNKKDEKYEFHNVEGNYIYNSIEDFLKEHSKFKYVFLFRRKMKQ